MNTDVHGCRVADYEEKECRVAGYEEKKEKEGSLSKRKAGRASPAEGELEYLFAKLLISNEVKMKEDER